MEKYHDVPKGGSDRTASSSRVPLRDPTPEYLRSFRASMSPKYRSAYADTESSWHGRVAWRRPSRWPEARGGVLAAVEAAHRSLR